LSFLGFVGAILLFCWLIVFQFRKNLIEERRILATYVPSAPNADGLNFLFGTLPIRERAGTVVKIIFSGCAIKKYQANE
jgi:hypothetical protein